MNETKNYFLQSAENPQLLKQMLAGTIEEKQKMELEIGKFKTVAEVEHARDGKGAELYIQLNNGEKHWYKAYTEMQNNELKITGLEQIEKPPPYQIMRKQRIASLIYLPLYLIFISIVILTVTTKDEIDITKELRENLLSGLIIACILYIIFLTIFKLKKAGFTMKNPVQNFIFKQIQNNPALLNSIISNSTANKEQILEEIKKFKAIKEFKTPDKSTIELLAVFEDGSEHWYRAAKGPDKKIISINRYS